MPNGAKKIGQKGKKKSLPKFSTWRDARHKLVQTKAHEPIIKENELEIMKKIEQLEGEMPTNSPPTSTSTSSMDIFIF